MTNFKKSTLSFCIWAGLYGPVMAYAATAPADDSQISNANTQTIIKVRDRQHDGLTGKDSLDEEAIRRTPSGDGNLSDMLKSNVNVRFETDEDGFQGGEIKPASVSINGAEPSQTAYSINGININNDIDPTGELFDKDARTLPGMSNEQAYFFDANMLSNITVYDSNIPANLGGFTGGAVVAETQTYQGVNGVSLNYRTSRSEWASMQTDSNMAAEVDEAKPIGYEATFQPDYRKNSYNMMLQQGLTDELGMVVGLSRRDSSLRQARTLNAKGEQGHEDQTRRSDNAMVNFAWTPNTRTRIDWDLRASQYQEQLYVLENIDNNFTDSHKAYGTTLHLQQLLDSGSLSVRAGFDQFIDERDSNSYHVETTHDEWNELHYEVGGYGDSQLKQRNIQLLTDYTLDRFVLGATEHQIRTGIGFTQTDYDFYRPKAVTSEVHTIVMPDWSFDDYGHAVAGKVSSQYRQYSAYVEDNIGWGDWQFRPGIRVEHDDYINDVNLSPRFAMTWQALADTRLDMGLNRYYGRSFASMALAEKVAQLDRKVMTIPNRNLKTPYSDEFTFGVTQVLDNWTVNLRYNQRHYQDRLIPLSTSFGEGENKVTIKQLQNGEEYKVDLYTIQVANIEPLVAGISHWNVSIGADWMDTPRNDLNDPALSNEQVILDGQLMTRREMEGAVNSSKEQWQVRAGVDMTLPMWNVTWSNKFYLKAPVRDFEENESVMDPQYPTYYAYDYGTHTQWDSRLRWQPPFAGQSMYVQFDVENVLNKVRQFGSKHSRNNGDYGLYTPGRQFWLELGYQF
ncbi:TonB-dependent receptor plug domain-containing protein [Shewanella marina]|uniref:TonB-dependent receptor plug domain-containing protein n=1 Tax=Shewanella marina TaxID=487319 RepID=UPI0009FE8A3F|nr:TonB-dependent receptor [Shewanella marina]